MKIYVIPDVHGSHKWQAVKNEPAPSYDYIVFMGDYFDCWENEWPDQGENFKAICDFVREDPEHRKLLLGNHDWSYLSKTKHGSGVSGHQHGHIDEIRNRLTAAKDILDLAFETDGLVFSHAGFSRTWVQSILNVLGINDSQWSIQFLNDEWHKLSLTPQDHSFNYAFEELLDWYGFFSPSGNEISQGPLWIRPEALLKDAYYKRQVVGHTEYCLGEYIIINEPNLQKDDTNYVIMTDSPTHDPLGIIDTQLQDEPMSLLEFSKYYKKTLKKINDIKSQAFAQADSRREFIMDKLTNAFGENLAQRYYKIYFE